MGGRHALLAPPSNCLQGNIILTDHKYEILTLLRSHRDDDKGLVIMSRHPYPMHSVRLRQSISRQQLVEALEAAQQGGNLKGRGGGRGVQSRGGAGEVSRAAAAQLLRVGAATA